VPKEWFCHKYCVCFVDDKPTGKWS